MKLRVWAASDYRIKTARKIIVYSAVPKRQYNIMYYTFSEMLQDIERRSTPYLIVVLERDRVNISLDRAAFLAGDENMRAAVGELLADLVIAGRLPECAVVKGYLQTNIIIFVSVLQSTNSDLNIQYLFSDFK